MLEGTALSTGLDVRIDRSAPRTVEADIVSWVDRLAVDSAELIVME